MLLKNQTINTGTGNADNLLRITEIFYSLQGESTKVGLPTTFIRLTGCPLRCQYCDTSYAFKGGKRWTIDQIFEQVYAYQTQHICVTGGEPLAQPHCLNLLSRLCNEDYQVSLETSGALSIQEVPQQVVIILDLKTPDSLEEHRNLLSNLAYIKPKDQIKFVICSHTDYIWAKEMLLQHQLIGKAEIIFSPSHEQLPAATLADWIIQDQLPVRFGLQLHKILWHDARGK